jgi:hypothetical protein
MEYTPINLRSEFIARMCEAMPEQEPEVIEAIVGTMWDKNLINQVTARHACIRKYYIESIKSMQGREAMIDTAVNFDVTARQVKRVVYEKPNNIII